MSGRFSQRLNDRRETLLELRLAQLSSATGLEVTPSQLFDWWLENVDIEGAVKAVVDVHPAGATVHPVGTAGCTAGVQRHPSPDLHTHVRQGSIKDSASSTLGSDVAHGFLEGGEIQPQEEPRLSRGQDRERLDLPKREGARAVPVAPPIRDEVVRSCVAETYNPIASEVGWRPEAPEAIPPWLLARVRGAIETLGGLEAFTAALRAAAEHDWIRTHRTSLKELVGDRKHDGKLYLELAVEWTTKPSTTAPHTSPTPTPLGKQRPERVDSTPPDWERGYGTDSTTIPTVDEEMITCRLTCDYTERSPRFYASAILRGVRLSSLVTDIELEATAAGEDYYTWKDEVLAIVATGTDPLEGVEPDVDPIIRSATLAWLESSCAA